MSQKRASPDLLTSCRKPHGFPIGDQSTRQPSFQTLVRAERVLLPWQGGEASMAMIARKWMEVNTPAPAAAASDESSSRRAAARGGGAPRAVKK